MIDQQLVTVFKQFNNIIQEKQNDENHLISTQTFINKINYIWGTEFNLDNWQTFSQADLEFEFSLKDEMER
jgi:hypothetical protein